jgi:hypothetical protein
VSLPDENASRTSRLPTTLLGGLLLAGFLLAGTLLRLMDVGPALLFGDELHSLRDMHGGYSQILTHFSPTGGGLALPLIQRLVLDLFGDGHWSIRAPAWVAGLALLYLTFPIARRHLGEPAALVATACVAVAPLLVFYSHFARVYSLVALLCLLLYDRLERATRGDGGTARSWLVLVGLTALLPWAHPTALGFVLPLYAGALLVCGLESRGSPDSLRPLALRLAGALGLAGVLCALAYWPARESLLEFVASKSTQAYYGDFGALDVASLIAGSRVGAIALAIGLLAAAAALVRDAGPRSAGLLFAVVGPPLTLALLRPYGDAYAYARYVLPSVVPACMLLGRGLALAAAGHPGLASRGVPLAGAAIALALGLTGPLGPDRPRVPQHANTYLSMSTLPAFDAPWPDTPRFYRELAKRPAAERARLRLVELPALTTRTRHLYRHYQLQHGIPTLLAPLAGEFPRLPTGPYVSFQRPGWKQAADADYLIIHLDVAREIAAYWRWLYGPRGPADASPEGAAAFMERHHRYGGLLPRPNSTTLSRLAAELGQPLLAEDGLLVWDLRRAPAERD